MSKLFNAIAASTFLIGSQFAAMPAFAQTSVDGTYQGTVAVNKGIALTCVATVTISGGGTAADLYIDPGDLNCGALVINSNTHVATVTPSTTTPPSAISIKNVDVTTITLGDCYGDLDATWSNANTIVVNDTIPPKTAGAACSVVGSLTRI